MRYEMKSSILIIWAASLLLQSTGVWGQRIRLAAPPTPDPTPTNAPETAEDNLLPADAVLENGGAADEEGVVGTTEQVAINRTDANPSYPADEETVAISAVLFDGSPGPKDCRGNVILNVGLAKPGAQHSTPTCYNAPGVAQCGHFVANKVDGCEARVFNEPGCRTFANIAVFIPERRAFGGYVRSIEIRCGVVSVTPPPLNLPGLKLPPNAVQAVG
ncbi:putative sulfate permease ii [Rosellinia necatrix]|uniref:Putative sulfate permease ii n=1 Tax=Rosellinia necatrix TaxID=77044 RepID=A0A1W2TJ67_ROSNE|nr:putative sulfate permease ii [Rosellinia necatrix]